MPRLRPRPAAPALLIAFAAACASTGSTRPVAEASANSGTQSTSIVTGGSGGGTLTVTTTNTGPGVSERALPLSADSAFQALVPAYEAVGITPNTVVSAQRTVGVREGQFRRALRRRRLSEFLECGTGSLGGPNADEYNVRMTVMSRVVPAPTGGGSLVSTQVLATAQSATGNGDPVQCASNGRLEQAINAAAAVQSAR